jgi:hypothetical protein
MPDMKNEELTEGVHYYFNEEGLMVFTEHYHLEKGYCCGMGCLHCPYEYEAVPEPRKSELLRQQKKLKKNK